MAMARLSAHATARSTFARYCDEARDALTAKAAAGDAKSREFIASILA